MEKHSFSFFPTLFHLHRQALHPDQLRVIENHCLLAEAQPHEALFGNTASSFSREARLVETLEASYPMLQGMRSGLDRLMRAYGEEMGFDGLRLTNSWFNIQRPGSLLKHHVHPDSTVSAALCISADENSSALHFENPNPMLNYRVPDRRTEFGMEMVKFHLLPGDLVFFPSWIRHGSGSMPNMSDTRIVISFNSN